MRTYQHIYQLNLYSIFKSLTYMYCAQTVFATYYCKIKETDKLQTTTVLELAKLKLGQLI